MDSTTITDADVSRLEQDCGCEENSRLLMSRRTLLAGSAVGLAAGAVGATQYAFGSDSSHTIVVLSLRGGLDGLSVVAPVADPDYIKARPTIAIPQRTSLKLDGTFGMHPALAPLMGLWNAKKMAVVHAVGQTSPTRSHFKAMEDMENAAPGSSLRTGWLDRMLGLGSTTTFGGVALGGGGLPTSMMGPYNELQLGRVDDFTLSGASTAEDRARWTKALKALHAGAPASIATPAASALAAIDTAATIKAKGDTPANGASYPDGDLGRSLRDVARLVRAKVGLRTAAVDVGNWDMHVGLGASDKGWMFNQLTTLGKALAAFFTDLGSDADKVTLVTLSEFGRRVAENASGGLDHGHGNVCLVMGAGVAGGKVYGRWPGLSSKALVDGDLAGTTDYRTILAEVLEKKQKLTASKVFPGLGSGRLGMLTA